MSIDRWFDDITQRHLEGRFIDLEVEDQALSKSWAKVMKTIAAIEIRVRPAAAGPAASTTHAIKPHNRNEYLARFPAAWAAYEAEKEGRHVEAEQFTHLRPLDNALSRAQITKLTVNGFGSVERFLAMPDSAATEILGFQGPGTRDGYLQALEKQREKDATFYDTKLMPRSTPIAIKGPIDKLTFDTLKSRAVAIYEEIAAWDDAAARAYLGPKGQEVRAFARAELAAKAMAARNPVDDGKAATVSDATSKAAPPEKQSKSRVAR